MRTEEIRTLFLNSLCSRPVFGPMGRVANVG